MFPVCSDHPVLIMQVRNVHDLSPTVLLPCCEPDCILLLVFVHLLSSSLEPTTPVVVSVTSTKILLSLNSSNHRSTAKPDISHQLVAQSTYDGSSHNGSVSEDQSSIWITGLTPAANYTISIRNSSFLPVTVLSEFQ